MLSCVASMHLFIHPERRPVYTGYCWFSVCSHIWDSWAVQ